MPTSPTTNVIEHLRRTVLREGAGLGDGELLGRFLEHHDEAALAALVRRHGPMVWGVCRRLLGHHDAEDAFQATFLVLVRKAASVVPRELVGNFLYGVAHQTALQARRTAARRRAREVQVTVMPDTEAVPQDQWLDVKPLLDQELGRLPDIYRTVVVLCDLEGRTRKEVARQLGVPEGTVAGRLARARALLAKRLTERGVTLSGGVLAAVLSRNVASAGVPNSVVSSTIKAASLLAAGQAAAGAAISVKVAALTEGVMKAMLFTKLKAALAVVLILGFVATGATILTCRTAAGQDDKKPAAENPVEPAAKQELEKAEGDALQFLQKTQGDAEKLAKGNKAIHDEMLAMQKKAAAAAAAFEYPGAKRLDASGASAGVTYAGAIYQSLSTTMDDLAKVAKWYDRKLAGLLAGQPAGAEGLYGAGGEKDRIRRAVSQDGERPELDAIAKRPLSVRSYLVRTKSYTISVVLSRPPGEALSVISLTYMPE
jgi:RNA polymerase sigma factor (sigma-70 family)